LDWFEGYTVQRFQVALQGSMEVANRYLSIMT